MTLRLKEVPIPKTGNPFENCKLDRKKYAIVLNQIIETYSDGFVLSLNNKWGEGKTTFIKMWRIHLGNNGFKTIYFNAWEHDFNNDPLTAILSELKTLEIYDKNKYESLIKRGAKITASLVPILMGALAEKYIDTISIKEAFKTLSEEAADIFEEEVNEYANKKKNLEDFKKDLELYVSKIEKKPLVFFIDELDRCNPKYAVELLEVVKHFFSVPGIVFVVSIDKEQLSNSIKGYFGSENLNTEEYLRRFFDLEYSIPKPDITLVINWMLEKYNFKQLDKIISKDDNEFLKELSIGYLNKVNLPIRLIEKLFLQIRLAIATIKPKHGVFAEQLFILMLIKFFDQNLYFEIKNKSLETKDFVKSLSKFISFNDTVKTKFSLVEIEARFAFLYSNNFKDELYNQDLIKEIPNSRAYELQYEPQFDNSENFNFSLERINEYRRNIFSRYNLDYLIQKIELLEPLQA